MIASIKPLRVPSILEYVYYILLNRDRENYCFRRLLMMIVCLRSVNDCLHNSCGPATFRRQKVAIDFNSSVISFSDIGKISLRILIGLKTF